ncbi:MAG: hypothetical protein KGD64_09915 [Candidatus Heimdallarchaeota archaeon]|nr:hypothetical protein [Candidatus Heimdallarchaeota archaeon]
MTGQISDSFLHNGKEFLIVGINNGKLFDPLDFNLETSAASTACWRGFQAFYAIHEGQLVLQHLYINLPESKKINGMEPSDGVDFFKFSYPDINLKMKLTGTILIAQDFIQELYIHMGFQRPICFETVLELQFKNGKLVNEKDLSKEMAKRRMSDPNRNGQPTDPSDPDEVRDWIGKSFSLEYETE